MLFGFFFNDCRTNRKKKVNNKNIQEYSYNPDKCKFFRSVFMSEFGKRQSAECVKADNHTAKRNIFRMIGQADESGDRCPQEYCQTDNGKC